MAEPVLPKCAGQSRRNKRQLYVIEEDGQIHGVFAFILGADPTYAVIEDGAWRSDEAYGTIHHIADGTPRIAYEKV